MEKEAKSKTMVRYKKDQSDTQPLSAVETPALLIDKSIFQHNIAAAESLFNGTGKNLRPHLKAHCVPELAVRQVTPSVCGATCSTVNQAIALINAGLNNLLIANEIASPIELRHLLVLAERASLTIVIDSFELLKLTSKIASDLKVEVDVLVDVDIGLNRCGAKTPHDSRDLALAVADAPYLRFLGLMGYEGRFRSSVPERSQKISASFSVLRETKSIIEGAGIPVRTVSSSGTSTLSEALEEPIITEIQAGTYALMEPELLDLGLPFRCAIMVMGTVISKSYGRVVLNIGRRSIGSDYGPPIPIVEHAATIRVTDDHTILSWQGDLPEIGSSVFVRPSQTRTTFNLYRTVWMLNSESLEAQRFPALIDRP